MSESDKESEDLLSNAEVNLAIFEGLFGATRERLPGDLCGLVRLGTLYGTFKGHDRFEDDELWEGNYQGPDFCTDLGRVYEAEELLARQGSQRIYVEMLMAEVRLEYQRLKSSDEVLDFWYALTHINALLRARAVARVLWNVGEASSSFDSASLEQDVQRAIELALPIAAAAGDDKTSAGMAFLDFVKRLKPQRAEDLIAVMYLGRGDQNSFAAMRRVVDGWALNQDVLARQMAGKSPLAKYLRDGLAKLKKE